MNKITELRYDYKQACSDGKEIFGEEYETARVGEKDCIEIIEHGAAGEGDRWYYDITFKDGSVIRTFNPNRVLYAPQIQDNLHPIMKEVIKSFIP